MTLLAESTSILGSDSVEIARNEMLSTYYLRVYPNQSHAVSNDYDLLVVTAPAELCEEDPFEPDDPDTIPLLPDGLHDPQLCAGDEDAFRFAIPAGNTVSWTLTAVMHRSRSLCTIQTALKWPRAIVVSLIKHSRMGIT